MVESQVHTPTYQESISWQKLSDRAFIDGSHDNVLEILQEEKKIAPFAFDLGREYELAQAHGEKYKKYFIENAHYYAKESFGRVPISEYEHKIITDSNGNARLALGPNNDIARDSYLVPALDREKPEWYRKRSMADVLWVDNMEKNLVQADEGDTFIDFSPTVYDVDVSERKKWGYGYHSFVRLHRVVREDGQKKLVSRAVRNYLDAPEQEVLFEQLTGEQTNASGMLGRVEKVNPAISQAYVKHLSENLYEKTPAERKIVPPEEYSQNMKNEQEMDDALNEIDTWLEVVYEMMQQGVNKQSILRKFRGWENAIRDFVDNKETFRELKEMDEQGLRLALYRENSILSDLLNREYKPSLNGCGNGSGFAEIERNMTSMTYQSMTGATESGACPEIKCKKCTWKADEKEIQMIQNGKMDKCPRCGWKP